MKLRKLLKNNHGSLDMILSAIVIAIGLVIGIIIVYNVLAAVDTSSIDSGLSGEPALNATGALLNNTATFYTVAPISIIVVAAVGILGYVMLLRRK